MDHARRHFLHATSSNMPPHTTHFELGVGRQLGRVSGGCRCNEWIRRVAELVRRGGARLGSARKLGYVAAPRGSGRVSPQLEVCRAGCDSYASSIAPPGITPSFADSRPRHVRALRKSRAHGSGLIRDGPCAIRAEGVERCKHFCFASGPIPSNGHPLCAGAQRQTHASGGSGRRHCTCRHTEVLLGENPCQCSHGTAPDLQRTHATWSRKSRCRCRQV